MSKTNPLIAIVDDNESVCRALQRLVRSLGMNADTFTSGQEFIDFVEAMPSFHVDCVVLNVQMAGLSGLEVQESLVRISSQIPVIFITGHDDVATRERALAAGALALLHKPVDAELFIKTLRVALKRGAGRRARR